MFALCRAYTTAALRLCRVAPALVLVVIDEHVYCDNHGRGPHSQATTPAYPSPLPTSYCTLATLRRRTGQNHRTVRTSARSSPGRLRPYRSCGHQGNDPASPERHAARRRASCDLRCGRRRSRSAGHEMTARTQGVLHTLRSQPSAVVWVRREYMINGKR